MGKKKVLILAHAMELGGAERALLGLLNSFDYETYQVDLFLLRHAGELFHLIPENVTLLPEIPAYACLGIPIRSVLRKKCYGVAVGRLLGKLRARRFIRRRQLPADNGVALEYSHKYTKAFLPQISPTKYDVAISFLTPHYFGVEKVTAKKRIAWIHTDYKTLPVDVESEGKMWGRYDWIVSISDACTAGFKRKFPQLAQKVVKIENIIPTRWIRQQADRADVTAEMPPGVIRLLSVGRFTTAKNFDNVPEICSAILESGLKIHWYLIGFGPEEALIQDKISAVHMEPYLTVLGKRDNPYPYMKTCDVYVQPSRYEGNCVSVHEAQVLGKPVVITAYETAPSQLKDGVDGVIVPMENKACAASICRLLKDRARLQALAEHCRNADFSNQYEMEKLYRIMDDPVCT